TNDMSRRSGGRGQGLVGMELSADQLSCISRARTTLEVTHAINSPDHHPHPPFDRCVAHMAVQCQLGLLSWRWCRLGADHRADIGAGRTNLENCRTTPTFCISVINGRAPAATIQTCPL